MGAICKKEENKEAGLDLHNLWLKIKMEVKEEAQLCKACCVPSWFSTGCIVFPLIGSFGFPSVSR